MEENLFKAFVTLFVVIDPPGLLPIFIALTAREKSKKRRRIAMRAVSISIVILMVFAYLGDSLLDKLGISNSAFRIAGGILLLLTAIDMVFAKASGIHSTTDEQKEAEKKDDISVFPLAIPLIAGPGAIVSVIIEMRKMEHDPMGQWGLIGVICAILALTYLFLELAQPIVKILGITGTNVVGRVFGIILAGLAVQFMTTGIIEVLRPESCGL
jgi:multiple antibiotic resistance protein